MALLRTISTLLLVLGSTILFSGCAVIQQQLAPLVCNCEVESCPTDKNKRPVVTDTSDQQVALALVEHNLQQAHDYGLSAAAAQAEQIRAEEEALANSPEVLALEVVDPGVSAALVSLQTDEEREQFETVWGITPPANPQARVFSGVFRRNSEPALAVLIPGQALRIYNEGRIIASLDLSRFEADVDLEEVTDTPAAALDLLSGDVVQIKAILAEADEEEGLTYYLAIYKQIGTEIGTVFFQPFARRDSEGLLTRSADFRFLKGIEHRQIEWIELDAEGMPAGDPLLYEWNQWEGVFRLPGPPPRAPRRETPQS